MVSDFGAIGRGRRNDSESSSRESSPRPGGRRRSFSPPSDDDTALPSMACDDTPPPPDRPLIRQAVAFQATPRTEGINTYQATPSKPKSTSAFLPGQEVTVKTKEKGKRAPKTKRSDQFASQTGRFRVQAFDPSAIAEPAIAYGNGPYNALFRGPTPDVSRTEVVPTSSSSKNQSKPTGNKRKTAMPGTSTSSPRPRAVTLSIPTNASQVNPSFASTSEITPADHRASSSAPVPAVRNVRSGSSTNLSYYRRDYDKDRTSSYQDNEYKARLSDESGTRQPTTERDSASGKRQRSIPLRMVTVLINDTRSSEEDLQLAEVRVSLKLADDPSCGYWADAKELSQCLQASPSRIDGPAKVYTMRGKYRQFFLRVSADNKDEFDSANLNITPERTLEIVVEWLVPPGARVHGRHSPDTLAFLRRPHSSSYDDDVRGRHFEVKYSSQPNVEAYNRKRRLSPSLSDHEYYSSHDSSRKRRATSSSTARSVTHELSSQSSSVGEPPRYLTAASFEDDNTVDDDYDDDDDDDSQKVSLYAMDRGYESPSPDDSPEEVHKAISNAVATLIGNLPEWDEYFQATASNRVDAYLMRYECVERLMNKFVGELAPFHSSKHTIEKSHVIEALSIEDGDKYTSNCTETLRLVKLYGKNGSRYEDAKVVEMMNDKAEPELHANPIKRFLRLLREIEAKWTKDHGGELGNNESD